MNKERLLKLATHLRQEKLPIDWDFGTIVNECGTAGCALGNCQFVWPNDWDTASFGYFLMFNKAGIWFNLTYGDTHALFDIDDGHLRARMKLPHCGSYLTALQVAENIENFVENYE